MVARPNEPQIEGKAAEPFSLFQQLEEVIRLVVMMYIKYPLSLRNIEDLLTERGTDHCHKTVRFCWNRFGPIFAAEIRRNRVDHMRAHSHWRSHLFKMFVKINGEMHYLWLAVDHEGEVLESFATKIREKAAALTFLKKMMKSHGRPKVIVIDRLRSYGAALKAIGNLRAKPTSHWLNNRAENSHQPFRRRERAMFRLRRMNMLQKFSSVPASAQTISTRNATSSTGRTTKPSAPQTLRSGGQSRARCRAV